MSERRRPLEIGEAVARAEGVPDDLDATQREPYTIPSTRRRMTAGWIYLIGTGLSVLFVVLGLPPGLFAVTAIMSVLAVWHLVSAWRIDVLDPEALGIANRATSFAVGHASAVVGFDGWRARPVWNVLVFSADEPPSQRALVRVDARSGAVVETYSEPIRSGG